MVSLSVIGADLDIFSALDTLTSRFIIDNLFRGPLMKDRTVLLIVSHDSIRPGQG
jgi:hypothetical protein